MAYSTFSLEKAKTLLHLEKDDNTPLVRNFPEFSAKPINIDVLLPDWRLANKIGTEKALSEWIIAPLLSYCLRQTEKRSLFSGSELNVDDELGLNGTADFLLSLSAEQQFLEAPLIVVVESKKGELKTGHGQCVATMVAAQKFNEQQNKPIKTIWGICTTGKSWQFLKLENKTLWIDIDEYHIPESLEKIIGVIVGLLNDPQQENL